jgi:hypothetical protein
MDLSVFYSWQNDRPPSFCRYFIRDALKTAVSQIARDSLVEECPRLEHDTKGQPGIPAIADTIFEKIRNAAIFVGDITFIETTFGPDIPSAKGIPNPNVLLELGYSAKAVGWERIICVFNDYYGNIENQIFNLRHRRNPIRYRLGPEEADNSAQRDRLSRDLEAAIKSLLSAEYHAIDEVLAQLDAYSQTFLRMYAANDTIVPRPTNILTFGAPAGDLDTPGYNSAVNRLRQLGVIRTQVDTDTHSIAFQWTYKGNLVLKRLGLKR